MDNSKEARRTVRGYVLERLLIGIAIVILGILGVLALKRALEHARDKRRIADITDLQGALQKYFADHHSYPVSFWAGSDDPAWQDQSIALALDLNPYLAHLPADPINETGSGSDPRYYRYQYYSNGHGGSGQWYMLVFRLEDHSNLLQKQDGVRACDDTYFDGGNDADGIITIGKNCSQFFQKPGQ